MSKDKIPNIDEVVDLLGLERSPKYQASALTYMVKCPFCGQGDRDYHMKIDVQHGVYHCYACGGGQKGTGTLDLYARCRMGTQHNKGPAGNGKEILAALLRDLGQGDEGVNNPVRRKPKPKPAPIASSTVARDGVLDRAYRYLLEHPAFKLSQKHRDNLKRRGLDDEAIDRNGYATIPDDPTWVLKKYPFLAKLYVSENIEGEKTKYPQIKWLKKTSIILGFALAAEMKQAGIPLRGVPGTFQLKGHWCLMLRPGMMIPTRNRKGQVVAIQTRTDRGNLRYLTMSAANLPYGVMKDISRTHFPLANVEPGKAAEVLVTEGPLKADVIAHLYGKPVFLMAIHGVSNTRGLDGLFRELRIEGVTKIGNAFDMDKLCNTNVRQNSLALRDLIASAGLKMYQKCWDVGYAEQKHDELLALCRRHSVQVDLSSPDVLTRVARMADALKQAGVKFCRKVDRDGNEVKDYWRDETKGLDDYLLFRQKGERKEQEPKAISA